MEREGFEPSKALHQNEGHGAVWYTFCAQILGDNQIKYRYNIGVIRFEWDEQKNKSNRKKHGIWFEEAQQVFNDPEAIRYFDLDHSNDEDRFLLVGHSGSGRLLIVVHCEQTHGVIRIISARKATKKEAKTYEEGI